MAARRPIWKHVVATTSLVVAKQETSGQQTEYSCDHGADVEVLRSEDQGSYKTVDPVEKFLVGSEGMGEECLVMEAISIEKRKYTVAAEGGKLVVTQTV